MLNKALLDAEIMSLSQQTLRETVIFRMLVQCWL